MSRASAKQRLAAIEDCKFNPSVGCRNKAECSGCGWNPAVAQRRLERIKAEGPAGRKAKFKYTLSIEGQGRNVKP